LNLAFENCQRNLSAENVHALLMVVCFRKDSNADAAR
jgi:hypothetical protein